MSAFDDWHDKQQAGDRTTCPHKDWEWHAWRAATAAAHEADAKLADLIDVDDCRDCDSVKVCCCGADAAFKIAKAIRSRAEEEKK